ncbi:hypothetical protein NQZ79_g8847 [Umbelopsis isabellina]|nr:hypothetical protein NQZ79_g8847 [Umbelopsis isabellina]
MRLRSSWYTLLSLALFLATFAVYLRSFSRMQHAFMTTLKSGSLDDLEQLDGMIENLDIHIDEADRHRFAHHLANASFSKDSMGYVRAFIKYIEGEKMAVLHLYDNMLNFVLFKVIFICAVMNPRWAQVLVLALWIGILGFLHIFCKLSRDRFDHVWYLGIFVRHMSAQSLTGIDIPAFRYTDCVFVPVAVPVAIDTCQLLIKYVAHIFDNINDDQMQIKGIIMYYSELLADLLILLCTILQYLQLLIVRLDRCHFTIEFEKRIQTSSTENCHACCTLESHVGIEIYIFASQSRRLADIWRPVCHMQRDNERGHKVTVRSLLSSQLLALVDSPSAVASYLSNLSSIWGGKYLLTLLPWNIEVSLTARNSQFDDTSSVYSMDDRDDNMSVASTSTSGYRPVSAH